MKIMGVSENMPIKSITESLSHGSEVALLARVDTDKVNNSENFSVQITQQCEKKDLGFFWSTQLTR